jgi:hypothetical protein
MTDHADYPEIDLREQIVRIDHMIVDMQRTMADRDRKRQEIALAPWQVFATLIGAAAAFFAAGIAFAKLLLP